MLSNRNDLTSMLAGASLAASITLTFEPVYSIAALFFAWFALVTTTTTSEKKAFIFVLGGLLVAGNAYLNQMLDTNLEKTLSICVFSIIVCFFVDVLSKRFI